MFCFNYFNLKYVFQICDNTAKNIPSACRHVCGPTAGKIEDISLICSIAVDLWKNAHNMVLRTVVKNVYHIKTTINSVLEELK